MKLSLPAQYNDLTISDLMTLHTSSDPVEWMMVCGNVDREYVNSMPKILFDRSKEHLAKIREEEVPIHPMTITHNGVEYGFIPSWTEFTTGEWIDLEMWVEDFWVNADKIMALLYRPINQKFGSRYTIEDYTAKEDRTLFHDASASFFAGAMLFFWTSRNKLLKDSRRSLQTIAAEAMRSVKNGDGMITYSNLQKETSSKWMKSRAAQLKSFFSTSHI